MYKYRTPVFKILFYTAIASFSCALNCPADMSSNKTIPQHTGPGNLSALFDKNFFYEKAPAASFTAPAPGGPVTVRTTLRANLQKQLMSLISRSGPLLAAAVVLDPKTGAVLAMGNSATKSGIGLLPAGSDNYCVYGGFPAASLAKIITAAVALEKKGLSTDHLIPVPGRYHTLYKSQVGLEPSPYTPELIPLDKAFGLSINPYFGKMWLDSFTDREFLAMGRALMFNMPLEFDLPVAQSRIVPPADDFQRAEVASGYNTRTTISPLHAALIAAVPANGGKLMRPYIIDRITGRDGSLLYANKPQVLGKPLSARNAFRLNMLMQETVQNGTARNSFKYVKRIAGTRGWTLGGKTGSIDLPGHTGRCDWFAGFGQSGRAEAAVACILVHGDQRTIRSAFVGAELIRTCLDPGGTPAPLQIQAKKKTSKGKQKHAAKVKAPATRKKKMLASAGKTAKPPRKKTPRETGAGG